MSNVVALKPALERAGGEIALAPATVLAVRGDGVVAVRGRDGAVYDAVMALPVRYDPVEGDVLLVIAGPSGAWVIGVIDGRGATALESRGPVTVRSTESEVRIEGHTAVAVESPRTTVRTRLWELVSERAVQHATEWQQRVRALLSVQAGTRHDLTEGASLTQSRSATVLTEEKLVLNGKAIHLG